MTLAQRRSYTAAVICLTKKKAKSGIVGALNRFDDLQAIHSNQTDGIHWVVSDHVHCRFITCKLTCCLRATSSYGIVISSLLMRKLFVRSAVILAASRKFPFLSLTDVDKTKSFLQVLGLVQGCLLNQQQQLSHLQDKHLRR